MCISLVTLRKPAKDCTSKSIARQVPCGKCIDCLKARANAWSFRLIQQNKIAKSACFTTLTYETTPLSENGLPSLKKRDFQLFMKRLRKKIHPTKISYYACGEYGGITNRPHYHAIIFNLPRAFITDPGLIADVWSLGHVYQVPANEATIRYVTGYLHKGEMKKLDRDQVDYETGEILHESVDDRDKEFSVMSKKMGLNYLTPQMVKYHVEGQIPYTTLKGGAIMPLPRYFKDKIFSRSEKLKFNREAKLLRDYKFEHLFNNNYKHQEEWKRNKTNQAKKQILRKRNRV